MYRPVALVASLMLMWNVSVVASDSVSGQNQKKQSQKQEPKKAPAKTNAASMTGCVDEQEGQYLLIDERTRDPIVNLEAEGFETEGFAKHVGHKVTVRGTSNPGSARPIFRVRSIESISDTCGAQSEQSRIN